MCKADEALIYEAITDQMAIEVEKVSMGQATERASAGPDRARGQCDYATLLSKIGRSTFCEKFGHLYTEKNLSLFLERMHSKAYYATIINDPGSLVLLAMRGEQAIGYAVAGLSTLPYVSTSLERDGELKRLYIAAGFRGYGIGRRLMQRAIDWLSLRYRRILLGVYAENLEAQRFYARFGFVKVGDYDFMVGDHADHEFIFAKGPG